MLLISAELSIIQAFTKSHWISMAANRYVHIWIFPSHCPQRFLWSCTCSCSSPWSGCGQVFIWATSSCGCSSSTSSLIACWWAVDFIFLADISLYVFIQSYIVLAEIITVRSPQTYLVVLANLDHNNTFIFTAHFVLRLFKLAKCKKDPRKLVIVTSCNNFFFTNGLVFYHLNLVLLIFIYGRVSTPNVGGGFLHIPSQQISSLLERPKAANPLIISPCHLTDM